MPENPFLFTYILGAYGFLAVALWAMWVNPAAFALIRQKAWEEAEVPGWLVTLIILLLYSVFWFVPAGVLLAEWWKRTR